MLDEDNFLGRLDFMKEKCNRLCPNFYEWFQNERLNKFLKTVILSALEGTDFICVYYQKARESVHFVEKNKTTLRNNSK